MVIILANYVLGKWHTEMMKTVSIERRSPSSKSGAPRWKPIPNGARVELWQKMVGTLDGSDGQAGQKRHIFHIPHLAGIARGDRVTYLGVPFEVLHISDTPQLMGLELICELIQDNEL